MSRFEALQAQAYSSCVPLHITLELTLRCNLRCVHCYNFDRDRGLPVVYQKKSELTTPEIFRILEELKEEGGLYLALSGGEVFVHPDWQQIARQATRLGFVTTIKSNGLLVDHAVARRLAECEVMGLEISVYGADAATHDRFVQADGAFARTISGVRALVETGVGVRLSFVLTEHNAGQIDAMTALADSLGVAYNLDPQLTARYDGTKSSLNHRVSAETLYQLYQGPLRSLLPEPPTVPQTSVQCACARSVCGISAFGEVYPCIGAPMVSGDLRQHSFGTIWRESPELNWIRQLKLEDFPACSSCDDRGYCRRSSGVLLANTGHYNGPLSYGEDFTCTEAAIIRRVHEGDPPSEPARPMATLGRHSLPVVIAK